MAPLASFKAAPVHPDPPVISAFDLLLIRAT